MDDGCKRLLRRAGFDDEVARVEAGKCPFCGKQVDTESFRDSLSRREFGISGLCQECQDETFGRR